MLGATSIPLEYFVLTLKFVVEKNEELVALKFDLPAVAILLNGVSVLLYTFTVFFYLQSDWFKVEIRIT